MSNWVTMKKAEDITGLPASFFDERTSPTGHWPENRVWKWWEGRKLLDMDQVNLMIDKATSTPSQRGRHRSTACNDNQVGRPA